MQDIKESARKTIELIKNNTEIIGADGIKVQLRVDMTDEHRTKIMNMFTEEQRQKVNEVYQITDDTSQVDAILFYCFSLLAESGTNENALKEVNEIIDLLYKSPSEHVNVFNGNTLNYFTAPLINAIFHADSKNIVRGSFDADKGTIMHRTKTAEAEIVIGSVSALSNGASNSILRTSAMKLLDACICLLSAQNYHRTGGLINPKVMLDVSEYAASCGADIFPLNDTDQEKKRAKKSKQRFIEKIYEDLQSLKSTDISGHEMRNKLRIDLKNSVYGLVSSYQSYVKTSGKIQVVFDYQTAEYLVNGYVSQYPQQLLRIDNKHPYAYALGKKLTAHYYNDHNYIKGTNNSLKVHSILEAVPDFMTAAEHQNAAAQGRKNNKGRTVKKFEDSMQELQEVGVLNRWEYRTPAGSRISKASASKLNMTDFENLIIDFVMAAEIDNSEKQNRLDEKQKRIEDKKKKNSKKSKKST